MFFNESKELSKFITFMSDLVTTHFDHKQKHYFFTDYFWTFNFLWLLLKNIFNAQKLYLFFDLFQELFRLILYPIFRFHVSKNLKYVKNL